MRQLNSGTFLKQKEEKRNLWTQRSTFNLTIGRNERRQTKWACSPCGASHQQLVLVLTLIHWRKKQNKGSWQRGEKKKDRERLIMILAICKQSITITCASELPYPVWQGLFLHQASIYPRIPTQSRVITAMLKT